jgi:hypothetical protein
MMDVKYHNSCKDLLKRSRDLNSSCGYIYEVINVITKKKKEENFSDERR